MADDLGGDRGMKLKISAGGRTVETTLGDLQDVARDFGQRRTALEENLDGIEDMAPGDLYPVPSEARYGARDFLDAPDIDVIAGLLADDFSELDLLHKFKVQCLWKKTGGKAAGKCIKAGGPAKHFSGADFLIWIATDQCDGFTYRQIRALLYHELCHVSENSVGNPALRDHDVEIFRSEIERFGLWDERLKLSLGQLKMPLGWGQE